MVSDKDSDSAITWKIFSLYFFARATMLPLVGNHLIFNEPNSRAFMNCVFRDQSMFGADHLKFEVVVDVYASVTNSGRTGGTPKYSPVAAKATINAQTTQFHKGRSFVNNR